MTKRLVILGAGGFAREVSDIIEALQARGDDIELLGYVVEHEFAVPGTWINGLPLLGGEDALKALPAGTLAIGAVGSSVVRRRLTSLAAEAGLAFATLIHPDATVTPRVEIGFGSVVTAGVRITNNIVIGNHVHLNLNSTVGHDSILGDFVTVSPGSHISGNVHIGADATLGTGSVILPGVDVGAESTVGAGAVVVRDVPPGVTVVGVPAKPLERSN